jgi:hypothetical protein
VVTINDTQGGYLSDWVRCGHGLRGSVTDLAYVPLLEGTAFPLVRKSQKRLKARPGSVALGIPGSLEVGRPPVGADAHSCEQKGPYSKNQCKKIPTHAPLLCSYPPEGGAVGSKWNPDAPRCQVMGGRAPGEVLCGAAHSLNPGKAAASSNRHRRHGANHGERQTPPKEKPTQRQTAQ